MILCMNNIIYGMFDPSDGTLRYIGQTIDYETRKKMHLRPSVLAYNNHKNSWIKSLLALGLTPEFDVLEQFDTPEEPDEAEIWSISYWRSIGADLTNQTVGGSVVMRGRMHTPESRKKMSESHKTSRASAANTANRALENAGRKRSAEARAKTSAAVRKKWEDQEYRTKQCARYAGA